MTGGDGRPIAVFKVGGSLLDWPGLAGSVTALLDARPDVRPILIVGGGAMADALRDLDRTHRLGEPRSHAIALRVLDATAEILAAIVPGTAVVATLDGLADAWRRGLRPVLAPRLAIEDDGRESSLGRLPESWAVTTDSIAARVARLVGAAELTLLKSPMIPPGLDLESAGRLGLIDLAFAAESATIPVVRCVSPRHPDGPGAILRGG